MNKFSFGSICSGIEAASIALSGVGEPLWFSEIEPFPCAVLNHHFPNIQNVGDMKGLEGKIINGDIQAPDVIVAGTPCQAFSIAGERKSLNDDRGNLTLILIKILEAIDHVREKQGKQPCVLLWENVPGVLSTKDNAFGYFLAGLCKENQPLQPPRGKWSNAGYVHSARTITWRTLDAQHFGLGQRRKRVFLVASSRKRSVAQILIEQNNTGKHFEKIERKKETNTREIKGSNGSNNYKRQIERGMLFDIAHRSDVIRMQKDKAPTLTARMGTGGNNVPCVFLFDTNTIRKLTPKECERLQGFPDDYTKIPYRNKKSINCPDSPRYKSIGNSMAVPIIRWLGIRIKNYLGEDI